MEQAEVVSEAPVEIPPDMVSEQPPAETTAADDEGTGGHGSVPDPVAVSETDGEAIVREMVDRQQKARSERALELARRIEELGNIEAEKARANADFNTQIKTVRKAIGTLAKEIRDGSVQATIPFPDEEAKRALANVAAVSGERKVCPWCIEEGKATADAAIPPGEERDVDGVEVCGPCFVAYQEQVAKDTDTKVCRWCIENGESEEEATFRKADGWYLDSDGNVVCKPCWDEHHEGLGEETSEWHDGEAENEA